MSNRIVAGTVLCVTLARSADAFAHLGQHAHVHPDQGPLVGIGHWLAGLTHWTGGGPIVVVFGAGVAAALLRWGLRHRAGPGD